MKMETRELQFPKAVIPMEYIEFGNVTDESEEQL